MQCNYGILRLTMLNHMIIRSLSDLQIEVMCYFEPLLTAAPDDLLRE